MRTFLPLAFWYWLYNQLFFFLGALGFLQYILLLLSSASAAWIHLPAAF